MLIDPETAPADTVIGIVLSGLAHGLGLEELVPQVGTFATDDALFPGDILLDLAADIIEESGATRERPLDTEQIRRRLLPEDRAHTRAQHLKVEFAIRAAAMIRAGVDPALLDNVSWWAVNDLWLWSLEAVVVYTRAAADHAGVAVAESSARVAEKHDITI